MRHNILTPLVIAAAINFSSTAAMAHSDHDHSTVSYKWALSENLQAKIERKLESANPQALIGLNAFEQKKLEKYAIKNGNKFNTKLRGMNLLIEKTSGGLKVVNSSLVGNIFYKDTVPIKSIRSFSRAAMNSHAGHDHANLPYEWTFGIKTQDKIVRAMMKNEKNVLVGLNAFEHSLMEEYGIKSGNTLQTAISGHKFMIEKTSSGIKVIRNSEFENMAMLPQGKGNM